MLGEERSRRVALEACHLRHLACIDSRENVSW
jgi:hypothetical protein